MCATKYCGSCYDTKERHDYEDDVDSGDGLQEYCRCVSLCIIIWLLHNLVEASFDLLVYLLLAETS